VGQLDRGLVMAKWEKTTFPGVRFRKHPTRKHGVKFDQYFSVRYKVDGKLVECGIGWASEGHTATGAYETLNELKTNAKGGSGPRTIKEQRQVAEAERQAEEKRKARAERENLTFGVFFEEFYLRATEHNKKERSVNSEKSYFKTWIEPVLGTMKLRDIAPIHIERIKKNLLDAGRTPRTFEYIRAIIRQAWNLAKRDGYVDGDAPTRHVKVPHRDNRRLRFLTRIEAQMLIEGLEEKSCQVARVAALSLNAGLRFGEIAALRWGDVDLENGILTLRNTKNSRTRPAFLNDKMRGMFRKMDPGKVDELVFPNRNGEKMVQVSKVFDRTVEELGLNDKAMDPTQKLVFHSMRHSFASWLVLDGVSLPVVKELLGHRSIAMTERYAHLTNGALQSAVSRLDGPKTEKLVTINRKAKIAQ